MAANYIVVVEKEGSEPIVVGFETAEEAESWCKTINDAGERVWGGGFHNYARTPVQPLNPTEAAKKILDEAEDELGLDSDSHNSRFGDENGLGALAELAGLADEQH